MPEGLKKPSGIDFLSDEFYGLTNLIEIIREANHVYSSRRVLE